MRNSLKHNTARGPATSSDQRDLLCNDLKEIGRMLNSIIILARAPFEETTPYFTDQD